MTTFDNLPNEVQHLVIKQLHQPDIRECSVVCSSWTRIFQKALYLNVTLNNFSCTVKFLDTLKNNRFLGSLVNKLRFRFETDCQNTYENSTISKLFTHLPNLVRIDCGFGFYFGLLSNAILLNQLPRLKYIKPPLYDEEIPDYVTCALSLKDRLKTLTLMDPNNLVGGSVSVRLYNALDQFKNIEKIYVVRDSGSIFDLIEEITLNCPSLRYLDLHLYDQDDFFDTTNIITAKLTQLKIGDDVNYSSELVNYIMQKFVQLKSLKLIGNGSQSDQVCVDKLTLELFFNYLIKINHVNVQSIPYNEPPLIDSVGSFWKVMSESRLLSIELTYVKYDNGFLTIKIDDKKCLYKGSYPSTSIGSEHEVIIREYGRYITELKICGLNSTYPLSPTNTLRGLLMFYVLKYCENLDTLSLVLCSLNRFNLSYPELIGKYAINNLSFDDCMMGDNFALKDLSKVLARVGNLTVTRTQPVMVIETPPLKHIDLEET